MEQPGRQAAEWPIEAYALLGDSHGAALVAPDGSLDWCCLGRLDARPGFWRLLDHGAGSYFQVAPALPCGAERSYLPGSNVLRTVYATDEQSSAELVDFLAVTESATATRTQAPGWMIRRLRGVRGDLPMQYVLRHSTKSWRSESGKPWAYEVLRRVGSGYETVTPDARRFTLRQGETVDFVIVAPGAAPPAADTLDAWQNDTEAFWTSWTKRCRYSGPYREAVVRSALVLKMLSYAPSGGIAAAATTSLPAIVGGSRNWDYRFTWLRDATMTLQALAVLGYEHEARRFCEFIGDCCVRSLPELRVLYGMGGELETTETTLEHLAGYRGSTPVREGNEAGMQRQLDVYGEICDWAYLYQQIGGELDRELRETVRSCADFVCQHWSEPDAGIWEARTERQQYVHGKLMGWVALDRTARMLGDRTPWAQARESILQSVREYGFHDDRLKQHYGTTDVDAALLTIPYLNPPLSRRVLERSVLAVEQRLRSADLVQRYRTSDGISGQEGGFVICSFWLVDALLWLGRGDEARTLFESMLARRSSLGLLAEQIDLDTGGFRGNFPQAFSHLGLINSAAHLELFDQGGAQALQGTYADRVTRSLRGARLRL